MNIDTGSGFGTLTASTDLWIAPVAGSHVVISPSLAGQIQLSPTANMVLINGVDPTGLGGSSSSVAIGGGRKSGNDNAKELVKKNIIGKNDEVHWGKEIQTLTDTYVKRIDDFLIEKDKEIKQI